MNPFRLPVLTLICLCALTAGAVAASQTDWWRLPGAAVVEYADAQQGKVCSLFLYDRDTAAVLTWTTTNDREISLYNNNWHFTSEQQVDVAIKVGDTWLGQTNHNTPDPIPAAAKANHVTLAVDQPIEKLLQHAGGITVRLADHDMSMGVAPSQMRQLLRAVQRCRAVVQRQR